MTKKVNKIFVVVFIAIIFIMLFSMLVGRIHYAVTRNSTWNDNISNFDMVSIDWEKLYPYDKDISKIYQSDINTEPEELSDYEDYEEDDEDSMITKITGIISKFGKLGTGWSNLVFNYDEIAALCYVINTKLTDPSVGQGFNKLKNGYWTGIGTTKTDYESAVDCLLNYCYLQKYLENEGIDFLFCYAPNKECAFDNQLQSGVISYTNDNIDIYIDAMKALGINYMDFREKLHEDGLDHYSLFYKTDHHWNIDAGFWAASVIENELNERFDLNIEDVNTFGIFSRKTYKNAMFGSNGQAATRVYALPENFDILFPDFENEFMLEIPDKNIYATGNFEDIFIDYTNLNIVMDQGGGHAYETILYGNRPYVKITNLNNQDGPKILMIRDSFSIAVAPYLAFSCSELILLDTRTENGDFTGSVVNCIDNFKPDVVLALQCAVYELKLNNE